MKRVVKTNALSNELSESSRLIVSFPLFYYIIYFLNYVKEKLRCKNGGIKK
jgi:hypothetical protein